MSTMSLAISGTSIRQDSNGRFCLNDLHKAAGAEARHKPSNWLAIQQTQELIAELNSDAGIPASEQNQPLVILKGGVLQGTFVVKELVYAYATWISAKFFLSVIRAYDSVVLKPVPNALRESTRISGMEAAQLKKTIEAAAKSNKRLYAELYRKLYGAYGIDSYMNLPKGKLNEALLYLGLKPIEMPKTVMISVEEYNALKNAPRQNYGSLSEFPTITLSTPDDTNRRILVTKHNGATVIYELMHDVLIGTIEQISRDISHEYVVMKKEELIKKIEQFKA